MAQDGQPEDRPSGGTKRRYGTGSIFEKRNAWYGQWRVRNRTITRKLGPIRTPGSRDGLTRKMAEARLRKLMAEVTVTPVYERMTIAEAGERLIKHLVTRGRKASTTIGYESYLRVHVGPFFGEKPIAEISKDDIEEFVAACLENDQSVKSTRNYLGFLDSIFDFALRKGWVAGNPCKAVEKPVVADEDQDIRFLDQAELDALLAATAGPRSRRKPGTAERTRRVLRLRDGEGMPWRAIGAELGIAESTAIYLYGLDLDELGPPDPLCRVDRVLYLTAAMTGMRQGELLALRWMERRLDGPPDPGAAQPRSRQVRNAEVQALVTQHPARRRGRPRARAAVPDLELSGRRGPRLRAPAHRQADRPLAAAQAVQGGAQARRRPRDPLSRLEAYLRDADGGRGRPDAHPPGVDGPPRLQDDADLRRLRASRERGRDRQRRLRPRRVHQFVHQFEQKGSSISVQPATVGLRALHPPRDPALGFVRRRADR
jgi:integrase